MFTITRTSAAITLVFLLAVSWAAPAGATDEGKKLASDLLKEIAGARKSPGQEGLADVLERVPTVHNELADKGLRKKLQAALGKVLHDAEAGNVRSNAATILGRLNDSEGAFKQLSKALPKPKSAEATPSQLMAVKATAALAPSSALPILLKLAQKGKSLPAAGEAILALGNYGGSKKRVQILKEVLDLMGRHFAAAEAADANSKGGGARPWKALGASLIATANKLTGRTHPTAREWLDLHKEHKKKLAALFPK